MKVEIKPLEGKYYSTDLVVTSDKWDNPLYISIAGHSTWEPSPREIENGWDPDYGMDHVESFHAWQVALSIRYVLEGCEE